METTTKSPSLPQVNPIDYWKLRASLAKLQMDYAFVVNENAAYKLQEAEHALKILENSK